MFVFVYDILQVVGAFFICFRFLGKKKLLDYLGCRLPVGQKKKGKAFLLYAVSVGETKALAPLFKKLKQEHKDASFYVACRTEAGLEEARRSLGLADLHFLLPLDFSWVMQKLLERLLVDVLIVMEGDLWYNLLRCAKKRGALVFLVSAKISKRSYERLCRFSFFSKRLLSFFTFICAQNALFRDRFIHLGIDPSRIAVTGNLKLNATLSFLSKEEKETLKDRLGLKPEDFVVVIGSTHEPEEEEILHQITPLLSKIKVIFVPRHPERFERVKELFKKTGAPFISFSSLSYKTGQERVFLVDAMGELSSFYQIANLAITCGSFHSRLKGHNILEPILAKVPVLFGPYMEDQKDLVDLVLSSKAGKQVALLDLLSTLTFFIENPQELVYLQIQGESLLAEIADPLSQTYYSFADFIKKL